MKNNQKEFNRIFQILITIPIFYLFISAFMNLGNLLSPDYPISTKILNILFIVTIITLIYSLNKVRKENNIVKYKWVIISCIMMLFVTNRMIFFSPPVFFHLPLAVALFIFATNGHMFGLNPIQESKSTKIIYILSLVMSIILFIIGFYFLSISEVL